MQYREASGAGWILDIADASDSPLVNGIPLVMGVDLLEQHRHLGFTGSLWVQGAEHPDDVPTFEDLGLGTHVFWVTD
ncbi:phage baseplate plug family protein [Mycetohabitans sp. B46]|uniref:phage baseplate plug family protein n=1 Tax=Mycetohabitans sp. B46 TaxID=2772536 RepID=UPI003FD235A4